MIQTYNAKVLSDLQDCPLTSSNDQMPVLLGVTANRLPRLLYLG